MFPVFYVVRRPANGRVRSWRFELPPAEKRARTFFKDKAQTPPKGGAVLLRCRASKNAPVVDVEVVTGAPLPTCAVCGKPFDHGCNSAVCSAQCEALGEAAEFLRNGAPIQPGSDVANAILAAVRPVCNCGGYDSAHAKTCPRYGRDR